MMNGKSRDGRRCRMCVPTMVGAAERGERVAEAAKALVRLESCLPVDRADTQIRGKYMGGGRSPTSLACGLEVVTPKRVLHARSIARPGVRPGVGAEYGAAGRPAC